MLYLSARDRCEIPSIQFTQHFQHISVFLYQIFPTFHLPLIQTYTIAWKLYCLSSLKSKKKTAYEKISMQVQLPAKILKKHTLHGKKAKIVLLKTKDSNHWDLFIEGIINFKIVNTVQQFKLEITKSIPLAFLISIFNRLEDFAGIWRIYLRFILAYFNLTEKLLQFCLIRKYKFKISNPWLIKK